MKYRVGFDIGIKSVGWSVVENDINTDEPIRIVDLGVRTFDANEVDKTGESTAKSRRELRGARRRRRRKSFRVQRMTNLLSSLLKVDLPDDLLKIQNKDVYELRAKAINEPVDNVELCKIIFNLLKRRGFKSNRAELTTDKEEGLLKKAVEENRKFLADNGYRTIGEAIYLDDRFKMVVDGRKVYNVRNHGKYTNCFYRADLQNELELILKTQATLGKIELTDDVVNKIVEIFSAQRNFDEGPGEGSIYKAKFAVGKCTFELSEKRAPKASCTFELFTALTKLNSLKIDENGLNESQRAVLLEKILKCTDIKFSQIRKWLNVDNNLLFNLCNYYFKPKEVEVLTDAQIIEKAESRYFVKFESTSKIKKTLGVDDVLNNRELFDEVALLLSMCKSDSAIDEWISKNALLCKLSSEQIKNIKTLNFDKFGSLSIVAMNKIIPFLINGERYDVACESAGYNHSQFSFSKMKFLGGKKVAERLNDITAPTVKRAVNQTIRILNEIIKKYGSPQFVAIELARDFDRTPSERNKIEKQQNERYLENKNAEEIIKKYKAVVSGNDIVKLRLYNEQDCKCMYSGETIDLDKLFSDNFYQVDHALPISRSLDDSYLNKVLVKTSENQLKGNMTPYEYFKKHKTPADWDNYVVRVNNLKNINKRKQLLIEKYNEVKEKGFIERNSNDTRYISRAMLNLLQDFLLTEPNVSGYKKTIKCVSGGITSYLRKCWGINKIREDGDSHHCVDATVIAVATDGQIQKLTCFNKIKEKFVFKNGKFVAVSTGEVIDLNNKEQRISEIRNEEIENISKLLPKPYEYFTKELALRSLVKYDGSGYSESEKKQLLDCGYIQEEIDNAKPLFVSRMKCVKNTGAIHKETMYSTKLLDKTGMLVKTVPLSNLSLANRPEPTRLKGDLYPDVCIDGYLKPNDDRKFYLMLKQMLVKDKDALKKVAVLYKKGKNGATGIPVRKVKVVEYNSNPVKVNGGAFANDKMYRIDIFKKQGKYYIVPVYLKDVYAHKLPDKVMMIRKPWVELDDTYEFQFSLYQNDLVKIEWGKQAKFSKVNKNLASQKPDNIELSDGLFYYNSCSISTASIKILTCDRCYSIESVGVQNLANIQKYYVDIMGNVYKASIEKRKEV